MYHKLKNIKKSCKNNKFIISAPTSNGKFGLPDRSYFVSGIQNQCKYIIKKHEKVIDNPSVKIHVNKIGRKITFRIKTGNYLQLLTPEAMK